MEDYTTIYHDRILTNEDLAQKDSRIADWFARIGINPAKRALNLSSGQLLIIDPIYLADIYKINEQSAKVEYLRSNGILLNDFGGDISGPVFRTTCGGLKIVLVFDRVDENEQPIFYPDSSEELGPLEIESEGLGCDSASYIFLDYNEELKALFSEELHNPLFIVDLTKDYYEIGYEQWDTDERNPYEAWRRNIVIWRTQG
jgi:hypothetical protein